MASLDLYIDVFAQQLVSGLQGQPVSPLNFFQGDDPTLRIFLLYPTFNPLQPYTYIAVGGLSLQVAIGQKKGTGGLTYTNQLTWTASGDPAQPYFTAALPMNTAAINTAIGSNASTSDAWFQVVYLQGGVQTTVLEVTCTVNASVIQNGSVTVPPGLTAASVQYVNATFLTRTISGAITLYNPTTGKSAYLYLGDDNTLHCDPIN